MEPNITYKKAPLVELVVEVRWRVQTVSGAGVPPIVSGQSASSDIWFQQLTERVRSCGFHNLERLMPLGMPSLAYQPLYRYRRDQEKFPLIQFGHGIFTVNAGPPNYRSWSAFRPTVEEALNALIETKPIADDSPEGFSRVVLRYIDCFDSDLRAGASNYAFIHDDLGIKIDVPGGLLELATDQNKVNPTVAFRFPVAKTENEAITFQVAAGRLGGQSTIDTILDTTYTVNREFPFAVADVINCLQDAYTVIHNWFEKLTEKIRGRMEPTDQ